MTTRLLEYNKILEELKKSSEFNFNLIEQSPQPILVCDINHTIIRVNPALQEATGYHPSELVGLKPPYPWWIRDNHVQMCEEKRKAAIEKRNVKFVEMFKRKSGELFWVEVTPTAVIIDDKPEHFLNIWTDITDRKKREEDIQRHLSELIKAQETQKRLISCELHDEIIPRLAALALKVQRMIQAKRQPNRNIIQLLDGLKANILEITNQLRNYCHELRPDVLEEFGLVVALETLLNEMRKDCDLALAFKVVGVENRMNSVVELGIFRIVQEGISNIVKHSGAQKASIMVIFNHNVVKLVISDDGRGFVGCDNLGDFALQGKLGLLGIRERVKPLNGTFSIKSELGRGTRIAVEIPCGANVDPNGLES